MENGRGDVIRQVAEDKAFSLRSPANKCGEIQIKDTAGNDRDALIILKLLPESGDELGVELDRDHMRRAAGK